MLEPEGWICDEPVSMLDASVRSQILNVLVNLQKQRGLALIFITHDLSLAWSLCDRIAVMYLGRIVEEGSRRDRAAQAPLHAGSRDGDPGADLRRRQAELLKGELPTRPTCPRAAGSTRVARSGLNRATGSTPS